MKPGKAPMLTNDALREEEATFEQEDIEHPVPPTDVVAYNELRSCADLFRIYQNDKLEIQFILAATKKRSCHMRSEIQLFHIDRCIAYRAMGLINTPYNKCWNANGN